MSNEQMFFSGAALFLSVTGLVSVVMYRGFDGVSKRFDAVDKRFDRLENKIDILFEKFANLDKRVAVLEETRK